MKIEKQTQFNIEDLVYTTPNHTNVFTNTRIVAEITRQRHSEVLRRAKKMYDVQRISERKIALATYTDNQGKPRKMYELTKAGAMALMLSFKGSKYDRLRLDFAEAFENQQKELEAWRNSRHELKEDTKTLHDVLKPLSEAHKKMYPESRKGGFLYNHVHSKINKAVLGRSRNLDRNMMTREELDRIDCMESSLKIMLHEYEPYNPEAVRQTMFRWISGQ